MLINSRLINHSCDPSASAKIISINGQSKVRLCIATIRARGEADDNRLSFTPSAYYRPAKRSCTITSSRSRAIRHYACRVSVGQRYVEASSTRRSRFDIRVTVSGQSCWERSSRVRKERNAEVLPGGYVNR
jgi:hypothetical protein